MSASLTLKQHFTPAVLVVLVNYVGWRVGVFLDRFTGDLDVLGAQICRATWSIGFALTIVAAIYAFVRRFALRVRRWDFAGLGLALLAVFAMWVESEMSAKY